LAKGETAMTKMFKADKDALKRVGALIDKKLMIVLARIKILQSEKEKLAYENWDMTDKEQEHP
jgi:hypothetical protein